jgi:succinate dehydrogenase/fumarate reductase flavoprotein subunit
MNIDLNNIKIKKCHTLVLGSGAAGLNAAVQIKNNGIDDVLIISEGLNMGTSINTGSDKQTYYKLGMYGSDNDSPEALSKSFFDGGSMHGDLSLVEASCSARAFLNLVNLGVKFPQDAYGQFVGYKTDHDPLQRATSFGPYTSKEMCRVLIDEVKRRNISVLEKRVAISLITIKNDAGEKRSAGLIVANLEKDCEEIFEAYIAENIVFAVGGPGGIYKTSVYPSVHTGAIGLALMAGAKAQSLPESQYGMASIKFRWNVSGTYMQVLPKFISTAADGESDEQEFLIPYFNNSGELNTSVFLKGYQWPFDPRKVIGGSSLVDILVYIETAIKGRRVFLDYRTNCSDLDFKTLNDEAYKYLENSNALFGTPIDRLRKMNEPAISLYMDHGIDITKEPLEIAVCAQHNNGGLAGNIWWESLNIKHLFPVGEVNGSHGVYRPGGSALNSGQVAGYRAAEYIANAYKEKTLDITITEKAVKDELLKLQNHLNISKKSEVSWQKVRAEFQQRMTQYGSHIRIENCLENVVNEAEKQFDSIKKAGSKFSNVREMVEGLRNLQLCFAHKVYLSAVNAAVKSGVGSRGSSIVLDDNIGTKIHDKLDKSWKFIEENPEFRDNVLETDIKNDGTIENNWVERCPVPMSDAWFENAWADYREGKIYKTKRSND